MTHEIARAAAEAVAALTLFGVTAFLLVFVI